MIPEQGKEFFAHQATETEVFPGKDTDFFHMALFSALKAFNCSIERIVRHCYPLEGDSIPLSLVDKRTFTATDLHPFMSL